MLIAQTFVQFVISQNEMLKFEDKLQGLFNDFMDGFRPLQCHLNSYLECAFELLGTGNWAGAKEILFLAQKDDPTLPVAGVGLALVFASDRPDLSKMHANQILGNPEIYVEISQQKKELQAITVVATDIAQRLIDLLVWQEKLDNAECLNSDEFWLKKHLEFCLTEELGPSFSEFEKINWLRNWVVQNIPTTDDATLEYFGSLPDWNFGKQGLDIGDNVASAIMLAQRNEFGCRCGGLTNIMYRICQLFGHQVFTYHIGAMGGPSHIFNVVNIRINSGEIWSLQDCLYNVTFVDRDNQPLDILAFLECICNDEAESIKILGHADEKHPRISIGVGGEVELNFAERKFVTSTEDRRLRLRKQGLLTNHLVLAGFETYLNLIGKGFDRVPESAQHVTDKCRDMCLQYSD